MAREMPIKNKPAASTRGRKNVKEPADKKQKRSGSALHKTNAAFREQVDRSKHINELAAQLNEVMKHYAEQLKPRDFYQALLRIFRTGPLNNRFIFLQQLKGKDLNPKYPLRKLGEYKLTVKPAASKFIINLKIIWDSQQGGFNNDCYYYELILLTWDKTQKPPRHESQLSEWVFYSKGLPEFEFVFSKQKNVQHWLLLIHLKQGVNEKEIELMTAEALQIADAGTFNKKDLELLAGTKKASSEEEKTKLPPEKPRRKAKSWSKR